MKRYCTILATILILTTLLLTSCVGGTANPTPAPATPTTIPQLQTEIASLKSSVSALNGQVANLSSQIGSMTGGTADTTALEKSITDLQGEIVKLTARIVELEGTGGGTNANTTEVVEVTEWDLTMWAESKEAASIDCNVRSSPRKIEEEDDYTIWVHLINNTNSTITLERIVINLEPEDPIIADEDIAIESASPPILEWDTTIKERKDGTCSRIRFTAYELETGASFVLPPGEEITPGSETYYGDTTLRLEFELYYAN